MGFQPSQKLKLLKHKLKEWKNREFVSNDSIMASLIAGFSDFDVKEATCGLSNKKKIAQAAFLVKFQIFNVNLLQMRSIDNKTLGISGLNRTIKILSSFMVR